MPFMKWEKTSDGYKPIEITDEEMFDENVRRRGKRAKVWLDEANEMAKREKEKKMEFKKENVFTALNADELRAGDKVIVADTIANLREDVWQGINIDVLKEVNGEDCLSRFVMKEGWYVLAYLVERAENCTNCIENDRGCTAMGNDKLAHCWNWKPITKQKAEPHYRPFKDTDELIKVWTDKSELIYTNPKLTMPLIWVRRKGDNSDKGSLITAYGKTTCIIAEVNLIGADMTRLFTEFEFLNGTPCGVEE